MTLFSILFLYPFPRVIINKSLYIGMFFIIDMSGDCNVREVREVGSVFGWTIDHCSVTLVSLMLLNSYMNQMNCTCCISSDNIDFAHIVYF